MTAPILSIMASAHWETLGPPPLRLFAVEQIRAARELARLRRERRARIERAPRGPSRAVLVLPGLLAGDLSTLPMRRFLRAVGHRPRGWRHGLNLGPSEGVRRVLETALVRLHEETGEPVVLIGWSLGGIYARELARAHTERVREVITLASPFRDISATHAARLIRLPGVPSLREAEALRAALRRPPPVPSTSIYSRTDGIVAWQSCLEDEGPLRENLEVDSSHTGMGFHPDALSLLAERLAQPDGQWRPLRAGRPEPARS